MLVASVSMAGKAKPLSLRRASMSERSVLSYHRIQTYNKALEKTIQRLEQDAQNNLITKKIAARKLKNEWEQKHATLAKTRSCDTPPPARSVDESETQERLKASVNCHQPVARRMLRSGSVGALQLLTANPRKAHEGDNAEQTKCQQQLHLPTGCQRTRSSSVGGDQPIYAFHRKSGDRRTSMSTVPPYYPSGKKKHVPVRRLASEELLGRRGMTTNTEFPPPNGISQVFSSRPTPTISLTKEPNVIVNEESEELSDLSQMVPPRNVKCNAWENKSNSSRPIPSQLLPLSASPKLTQNSLFSSSAHSITSSSPGSPGLHHLGYASEDESPAITGSLLPIKTSPAERRFGGFNGKRSSAGSISVSLSYLKASQTTNKEQLLEAARMMNFGPETSKSHNPAIFKKFYPHIPAGRTTSDSSRDVPEHSPKVPQRRSNDW